jgi:hypothetical protein
MTLAYRILYRVGFTPWEQRASLPHLRQSISALFEREGKDASVPSGGCSI